MDENHFKDTLETLRRDGLLRSVGRVDSAQGPRVTLDGRSVVLMASNDYLGLANHPSVRQAAREAIDRFGVGAGAARLISGTIAPHQSLELRLARFKGTEAALLFSTGYMANLALLSCLVPENGLILIDKLSHASLVDGVYLSGRTFRVFPHRDLTKLARLLSSRAPNKPALIVTDGVFSMDGDLAPLPDLIDLAERYDANILLDDAHGTGVLGRYGRGTLEHFGLSADRVIQMGTLGKALGSFGAFVAGSRALIDFLINRARPFIFTTALPPAIAAAAEASLTIVETDPERRLRLHDNCSVFKKGLIGLGLTPQDWPTPIVPVKVGSADGAREMASILLEEGILAPAIRPPTVPRGTSRIRFTVTSEHTREDIDSALSAICLAAGRVGILP